MKYGNKINKFNVRRLQPSKYVEELDLCLTVHHQCT